jgi:hypothetical protein
VSGSYWISGSSGYTGAATASATALDDVDEEDSMETCGADFEAVDFSICLSSV